MKIILSTFLKNSFKVIWLFSKIFLGTKLEYIHECTIEKKIFEAVWIFLNIL